MKRVFWLTGLSGSGKTTIAKGFEDLFNKRTLGKCQRLDGDISREILCKDLGFTSNDRLLNIERNAFVASLLIKHDITAICSFISPTEVIRERAKTIIDPNNFRLIYVKCSLQECIERDSKGLYEKAVKGEIKKFTGITDIYEEPKNPNLILDTEKETVEESIQKLYDYYFSYY